MEYGCASLRLARSCFGSLAVLALAVPAVAQCPSWDTALSTGFTDQEHPTDFIEWDQGQGAGPEMFLAHSRGPHGLLTFGGMKRWHGSGWTEIGDGQGVGAFAVADTGTGPRLHAGSWRKVTRLENGAWTSLGPISLDAVELEVLDDGSGPTLYAAGAIRGTPGLHGGGILAWSNGAWVPAGTGLGAHPEYEMAACALCVFDDGGGPELYVGGKALYWPATGQFGTLAKRVAGAWVPVSILPSGTTLWNQTGIRDLRVHDDGSGPALYLGGQFGLSSISSTFAGVLRYSGGTTSVVGGPMSSYGFIAGAVFALEELHDAASGRPHLVAAGVFDRVQGMRIRGLASWNGSA